MIKGINLKSLAVKTWKDFLYFLSNPIPLSFSKMNTYQTCAYKYKLIYHDRQPGKPSPYLAYGTVMHDTLFEFESIPYGVQREYADLERLFQKNWDLHIGSYRIKRGRSIYDLIAAEKGTPAEELEKEAYDTAIIMLKNYWRDQAKSPNKVRYVEKWLFGELGHYHVTGRLDRLDQRPDGNYEIVDYKTGQRIYTEETLKDASRSYGLQAGVYYEMCREAWRDRVDKFIFKYLQKRQTLMDHLVSEWLDGLIHAGMDALKTAAPRLSTPVAESAKPAAMTAAVLHAMREKLEEKLLKKVVAEREEERIRQEIRKIRLEEEQEILKETDESSHPSSNNVSGAASGATPSVASRGPARMFMKALNTALEQRIADDVKKALENPEDTDGLRRVIREALGSLDEAKISAAVSAYSQAIESDFDARAAGQTWPGLSTPERERIANEMIEILYRREIKDKCAAYLRLVQAADLAKKTDPILAAAPEIRPDRRQALLRHVLDQLRSSFGQSLDQITPDEIAKAIAGSAPAEILAVEYVDRTNRLLDRLVQRTGVQKAESGRKLSESAVSDARRSILLAPLAETIKKIVRVCLDEVIADIQTDRSDTLTPALREKYLKNIQTLAGPLFVQTASRKIADAYTRQLFHEMYYKTGVVPVVEHVTRLFERPDVMNIYSRLEPGIPEQERKARAQRLIEKLNWIDAEVLVEETLGPGLAAWRGTIQNLMTTTPTDGGSVARGHGRPERPDGHTNGRDHATVLDRAAELFENRLVRVCTLDVEVPYLPETRENVIRAIEQVQEGLRRKEFSPSRGALCGWCEYQSGCPAWCKYRDLCKGICKDEYHCKRWFDEKTGRLVEGRPPDMPYEEYLRRVEEKYEVTDKSLFRLSFSKMNTFELCPMNYRKLYLDRVSPKPKSFFSIGLSFHQTMEDLYAYTGPKNQPSLKMLLDLFKKKWISAGYRSREEEDFNLRRGLRMCEDYYEAYIDGKYKPAGAAEDYFEFKIGRTLLCGFIDRVDTNTDGTISIIDYKTNPKLYTQEELDDDQQMTIYYLAAREGKLESANYKPVEVDKFIFQFVNFSKDLVATRDPSYLGALLDRVKQFTEEMEWRQTTYKNSKYDPRVGMLLFPPQDNKYCQSCDHHHLCPLKTDMSLSGEIQKKGTQFDDSVDAKELAEESPDRVATYDDAA